MAAATPLRRWPQLSDQVADHVRGRIMSGELRPGDFVRLDETAATLGVSVTPVREALLTLRSEGLVALVPRRGYTVAALTRRDVQDIFWFQRIIAVELARRAALSADESVFAELSARIDDLEAAVQSGSAEAVTDAEYHYHRDINRAAHSDMLARFLGSASRFMPFHFYADDRDWGQAAVRSHRELLAAMRAGDLEALERITTEELDDGCQRLIEHLGRAGVWSEPDTGARTGEVSPSR